MCSQTMETRSRALLLFRVRPAGPKVMPLSSTAIVIRLAAALLLTTGTSAAVLRPRPNMVFRAPRDAEHSPRDALLRTRGGGWQTNKLAITFYTAVGGGFAALLTGTLMANPIFPFQPNNAAWSYNWLITTIFDYYVLCSLKHESREIVAVPAAFVATTHLDTLLPARHPHAGCSTVPVWHCSCVGRHGARHLLVRWVLSHGHACMCCVGGQSARQIWNAAHGVRPLSTSRAHVNKKHVAGWLLCGSGSVRRRASLHWLTIGLAHTEWAML